MSSARQTISFLRQRMRESLTDRKQRNAQSENKTRKARNDEQAAKQQRHKTLHRLANYECLEYGNDQNNGRQVTQAEQCVLR